MLIHLIVELKHQDAIDKVRTFNSFGIDKHPHLNSSLLVVELLISCSMLGKHQNNSSVDH